MRIPAGQRPGRKIEEIAGWDIERLRGRGVSSIGTIGCDTAFQGLRGTCARAVVKEGIEAWACSGGSGSANAPADTWGCVEEVFDFIAGIFFFDIKPYVSVQIRCHRECGRTDQDGVPIGCRLGSRLHGNQRPRSRFALDINPLPPVFRYLLTKDASHHVLRTASGCRDESNRLVGILLRMRHCKPEAKATADPPL